jgi:hypothetical protein
LLGFRFGASQLLVLRLLELLHLDIELGVDFCLDRRFGSSLLLLELGLATSCLAFAASLEPGLQHGIQILLLLLLLGLQQVFDVSHSLLVTCKQLCSFWFVQSLALIDLLDHLISSGSTILIIDSVSKGLASACPCVIAILLGNVEIATQILACLGDLGSESVPQGSHTLFVPI